MQSCYKRGSLNRAMPQTPDDAVGMVCGVMRARPERINTRLGTFGEVVYALAPKAVDQVLRTA